MAATKNILLLCLAMHFVIAAFNVQSVAAHHVPQKTDSEADFTRGLSGGQESSTKENSTMESMGSDWECSDEEEEDSVNSQSDRDIFTETGPDQTAGEEHATEMKKIKNEIKKLKQEVKKLKERIQKDEKGMKAQKQQLQKLNRQVQQQNKQMREYNKQMQQYHKQIQQQNYQNQRKGGY